MKWQIPKKSKETIASLSKTQMKRPLRYVLKKFNEKSLREWRSILAKWKEAILSNQSGSQIHDQAREAHELIVRLIEIAAILKYQPEFN